VAGLRPVAWLALALSMLSFLGLWWQAGQPEALRRIALFDLAGLMPLLFVAVMTFRRG
jgi:hypothetical protein